MSIDVFTILAQFGKPRVVSGFCVKLVHGVAPIKRLLKAVCRRLGQLTARHVVGADLGVATFLHPVGIGLHDGETIPWLTGVRNEDDTLLRRGFKTVFWPPF